MPQPETRAHRDAARGEWQRSDNRSHQSTSQSTRGFRCYRVKQPQNQSLSFLLCGKELELINTQLCRVCCWCGKIWKMTKEQQEKSFLHRDHTGHNRKVDVTLCSDGWQESRFLTSDWTPHLNLQPRNTGFDSHCASECKVWVRRWQALKSFLSRAAVDRGRAVSWPCLADSNGI